MRILFTFAGGSGHLDPLIPIARAARARGHEVAFVGRPWMLPVVEALGFPAFAAGSDVGLTPRRRPLRELDGAREDQALRDGFAHRIARERAEAILPLCDSWKPDILVCEETDFGPIVISERLGLPHATVLTSAAGSFVRHALVAEPLNDLRTAHGLSADPGMAMLSRYLVLSPFPPSFRDAAFPLPATAHSVQLSMLDPEMSDHVPPWIAGIREAPAVYVTLGTVFNVESGDLFARVLAGLRDLPVDLVVTVGRDIDPAEFGPQPANVRIERFVPQRWLLPHCRLVVSHGGSGSVIGALAHGLPMVLMPMGADQPHNAARCDALGVARVLDAMHVTPDRVRDAVASLLKNPTYRRAAEHLKDEIAALPGPGHVVTLLEQLARQNARKPGANRGSTAGESD